MSETKVSHLLTIANTMRTLSQQIDAFAAFINKDVAAENRVTPPAPVTPPADAPAAQPKRGRPAAPKQETIPEVQQHVDEQKTDDKTITPGHPLRAKLQAVAKDACTTLTRDKVVATIALFSEGGQGSASVPDSQLAEAIKAIETKVANAKKKAEQAEAPL